MLGSSLQKTSSLAHSLSYPPSSSPTQLRAMVSFGVVPNSQQATELSVYRIHTICFDVRITQPGGGGRGRGQRPEHGGSRGAGEQPKLPGPQH